MPEKFSREFWTLLRLKSEFTPSKPRNSLENFLESNFHPKSPPYSFLDFRLSIDWRKIVFYDLKDSLLKGER